MSARGNAPPVPANGTTVATKTSTKVARPAVYRTPAPKTPMTMEYVEALKALSAVLYAGGLGQRPKGGVTRPEGLAVLIQAGREVGLSEVQAASQIMLTNGKTTIWGDAPLALVRASGMLEDIEEWFEGNAYDDTYTAICRVKRVGAARDVVGRFSIADAKYAGLYPNAKPDAVWMKWTSRMMQLRARSFPIRDEFGDVLCGLAIGEESDSEATLATVLSVSPHPPVPATEVKPEQRSIAPTVPPAATNALTPDSVATIDARVSPTGPPAETKPAAAHATEKPLVGPVTQPQIDQLIALRDKLITHHVPQHLNDDERKAVWVNRVKLFGVTSAKALSAAQAAEFIAQLEKDTSAPFA